MSTCPIVELLERLVAFDVGAADRAALRAALCESSLLAAWRDAFDARIVGAMQATESFPEQAVSDAQQVPFREAERLVQRAELLNRVPAFASALDAGEITAAHVDVLARAVQRLEPPLRTRLLDQADELVQVAVRVCVDTFRRELKRRTLKLVTDSGMPRFEAQRRATSLRWWVGDTGMWCLHGAFDPVTGKKLAAVLQGKVEAMFRERTPAFAPTDPLARQQHLAALALAELVTKPGTGGRLRWDVSAVIDVSDQPVEIDWGLPIDVPDAVRDVLFADAHVECIVVANGRILHAPGRADEGRSRRVASRAQRRMLRALYRGCAIPGCSVPFDRAKIHHIVPWEHDGLTDLHNLIPLCVRHHHCVHDQGWVLELADDRSFMLRLPDGSVLATGPPRRRPAA